jgi:acetyl esterase/lipase
VQTVRGRGIDGHRWALRSLLERAAWSFATHAYGDGRDQVADLRLPAGAAPPSGFPVVVLLHGGAWRAQWERDLMDALAVDLARRGYASWNVEYRRVGEGGGWPQTFDDVAAAIDLLPQLDAPLDLARVALLGHSAGGHLALWAAAREPSPAGTEAISGRSTPRDRHSSVKPALVVSLAGLPDMAETSRRATYDDGATALLGGRPDEFPDRYALASPQELLPLGVRQLLVHGTADQPDNVDMNRLYAERAAAAGDWVELLELEGVEHFAPIEPRSASWATIATRLEALL